MVDIFFARNRRVLIYFTLAFVAILFSVTAVYAMPENVPPSGESWQETNDTTGGDAASISRDEVNMVARELWCPLCSGVRLDVCELQACDQMREEIAIQLAQGTDTEGIKEYFLAQYGPQILGEPPRSGFNALAWIVPFVVLLGGGFYLFSTRRPVLQTAESVATAEGTYSSDSAGAANQAAATPSASKGESKSTDYENLLDKELEHYE